MGSDCRKSGEATFSTSWGILSGEPKGSVLVASPGGRLRNRCRGRCPHRPVSVVQRVSRAAGDSGPYGLLSWSLVGAAISRPHDTHRADGGRMVSAPTVSPERNPSGAKAHGPSIPLIRPAERATFPPVGGRLCPSLPHSRGKVPPQGADEGDPVQEASAQGLGPFRRCGGYRGPLGTAAPTVYCPGLS